MNVTPSAKSLHSEPQSLAGDALSVDAAGRPTLIGGVCRSCGALAFPFAPVCTNCMSENLEREPMSRQGTVYSFTVVHVGPKTWEKPYAVGYVDLDNGVRVFSHLRGSVAIGQTAELGVAEIGKNAAGVPIMTFVFQPKKV
jgi:uncharacterized OB-fold protein